MEQRAAERIRSVRVLVESILSDGALWSGCPQGADDGATSLSIVTPKSAIGSTDMS